MRQTPLFWASVCPIFGGETFFVRTESEKEADGGRLQGCVELGGVTGHSNREALPYLTLSR